MSEVLISPELSDEQFAGLVSGVANHEAKALTLAAMSSLRGEDGYFTSTVLDAAMHTIQGNKPGWDISVATPYKYCDESMGPIGAVTKSMITNDRGRLAGAYALTPFGKAYGLALAGMILDWSLKYPNLSVQAVLGSSQSKTANRTPIYRLAILESVLTAGKDGASYAEIAADHPGLEGIGNAVENIRRGAFSKVVTIATNQKQYDPVLTITDAAYKGKKRFDQLSDERRAIYETMQILVENDTEEISLNNLVDKSVELYPNISPLEVRRILTQATNRTQTGLPGLGLASKGRQALGSKKSSTIRINPEHEEALQELVSKLYDFKSTDKLYVYRERALEIVSNPEACAEIMSKAAHNSMKVRAARSAQPIGQIIMSTLSLAEAPLSAYEISEKLRIEHELPIGIDAVRNHLITALRAGLLTDEKQTSEQSGRTQILTYYQLATE